MKNNFLLIVIILTLATMASAQKVFLMKDASKNFDVKVTVSSCEDDTCEGAGSVELFTKDGKSFQKLTMANIFLELGPDQRPTANLIELYGENNSGIVFDDYNFDGREDLAVRNGNEGGYGGPSYDVFLSSKRTGKFVRHQALTRLASENLGLFTVDKKAKQLETFTKSGCCWHETTRYKFTGEKLVKVYIFTEDAAGGDGKYVYLTTKRLVGNRWTTTTKKALIKDYYKEQ